MALESVDLNTKETSKAAYERSDVCAVPAASVILENVAVFKIARAFVEKFAEVRARGSCVVCFRKQAARCYESRVLTGDVSRKSFEQRDDFVSITNTQMSSG